MDPEVLRKLTLDLDELCREHREKLQQRLAQLEGGAPLGRELFVLPAKPPLPPPPRLEPLKTYDWAKLLGDIKGSTAASEAEVLSCPSSPAAKWLLEGGAAAPAAPAPAPQTPAAAQATGSPAPPEAEPPQLPNVPSAVTTSAASTRPEVQATAAEAEATEETKEVDEGAGESPANPRRRIQKSASMSAAAMRATAMKNVRLAEVEEDTVASEDFPTASFSPSQSFGNSARQSCTSNFSAAERQISFDEDPTQSTVEVEEEKDSKARKKRRAQVEAKALGSLPPSLIAQAEDFGAPKRVRKSQFLAAESRKRVAENQTLAQRMISSGMYESVSGGLILLNCGFVAWQTQSKALEDEYRTEQSLELTISEPPLFNVIQGIFTIVFAIDLGVRIWADKLYFCNCRNREFLWNVLDSLVVAFDLFSLFLEVWVQFGLLRMMRVIRIVRVVKIIRVLKSFAELRMLMYSIISCIKSLVWVIAVLALMLGLFAVLFTSATGSELDNLEKRRDPKNALLVKTFGTLDRSLVELYLAMTGGTDWVVQYEAVFALPVIYHGMFLIYITFSIYALANVITSIFLENARKSTKTDREHVIQEEMASKTQYLKDIELIFAEMDADGNGLISRQEFEDTLQDERVVAYFRSMKLDAREAELVFNILDYDNSGEISYQEFVDGCWKLQGEARSLDMKIVQLEVEGLTRAVRHVQDAMAQVPGSNKQQRPSMRSAQRSSIRPAAILGNF